MRVVTQETVGGPEVLHIEERPVPEPGEGEVLVRIAAAGINPVDLAVRAGAFSLIGDPPFVLGWDIAGTVEKTGAGVTDFSKGDEVAGLSRFPKEAGAYAEYACVRADEIIRTPQVISLAQAAGLPLAGLTAWQALFDEAGLTANDRVLIHAGGGGVGHLAVQIAKSFGARVTTTVSPGKVQNASAMGADEVIDYQAGDFTEFVSGMDIVLDPIGGDHALRSLKVLKPGGIVVCLKAPSQAAEDYAAEEGLRLSRILVHPDRVALQKLATLATQHMLNVHVAKTFPLEQAGEAHRFLETAPLGKVVLVNGEGSEE